MIATAYAVRLSYLALAQTLADRLEPFGGVVEQGEMALPCQAPDAFCRRPSTHAGARPDEAAPEPLAEAAGQSPKKNGGPAGPPFSYLPAPKGSEVEGQTDEDVTSERVIGLRIGVSVTRGANRS